jgi:hypothetical protein
MQAHVSAEEAYYVVLRTVVAGKQTNWVSCTLFSRSSCPAGLLHSYHKRDV